MSEKYTQRGFRIYGEIIGRNGDEIMVHESSLATEHCVWVSITQDETRDSAGAQLTVEQARKLAMALLEFVEGRHD